MNNTSFHAFTTKHNGKIREIITEIGISLPFIEDNIKNPMTEYSGQKHYGIQELHIASLQNKQLRI